jgi:transposase
MSVAVGIDVGKATCHITIRRAQDLQLEPERFAAARAEVATRVLAALTGDTPATIAIESTGGLEREILAGLAGHGHQLMIARHTDSRALRRTLDVTRKTDPTDADLIARIVLWHLHPETAPASRKYLTPWEDVTPTIEARDEVRSYQSLIRDRTRLKTRLSSEQVPHHRATLEAQIAYLDSAVADAVRMMEQAAGEEERLLATIPGISLRRACILAAAIGDVTRFPNPDRLCGYLGLKPPIRDLSGTIIGKKRYRKGVELLDGELFMTALATSRIKRSNSLTRTYHRIKERKGGRHALAAVKRQIIRTAWGVLTSRQPYRD